MNEEIKKSKTAHLELQKARYLLEDEVRVKRKTIWVDCIRCQKVRTFYPSVNALIGH
jgi:hypothetical protein